MAYNAKLEEKIESAVTRWQNVGKKKMFGGVCWFLKGNMAFGIWKDFLILRMDRDQAEKSLKEQNTKPFDITGRPHVRMGDGGGGGMEEPGGTGQVAGDREAVRFVAAREKG